MSSLTDLLSTVGLGAPNPAAYTDATSVGAQQKAALVGLQASVAASSLALSVAKTAGVSSTTLDNLQAMTTKGSTLMSQASTMTPAQLEAARANYDLEMTNAHFTAVQEQYTTLLNGIKAVVITIKTRVIQVRAESGLSKELVSKYEALLTDAEAAQEKLTASPPTLSGVTALTADTTSGSSGSGPPPYAIPSVPDASDLQDRLDNLDNQEAAEMNGKFSTKRFYRQISNLASKYLYTPLHYFIIASSMLLGGIVMSNNFVVAEQNYTQGRIFYFIYGALLFPLAVLWGCIKPPFWVAGLFPSYPRKLTLEGIEASLAARRRRPRSHSSAHSHTSPHSHTPAHSGVDASAHTHTPQSGGFSIPGLSSLSTALRGATSTGRQSLGSTLGNLQQRIMGSTLGRIQHTAAGSTLARMQHTGIGSTLRGLQHSAIGSTFGRLQHSAIGSTFRQLQHTAIGSRIGSVLGNVRHTVSAEVENAVARAEAAVGITPLPTSSVGGNPDVFTESGSNILMPSSSLDAFSFVFVDDKNPPSYQTLAKNKLWYLCIADFIAIMSLLPISKILGL